MSFNLNIRPSSPFTFKDHHICDLARDHEKENLKCICKACKIQGNLLPHIKIIFFTGFVFPPLYFIIWGYKIYAIVAYYNELRSTNTEHKSQKSDDLKNDEFSENNSTLYATDPFSDEFDADNFARPSQVVVKYKVDYDFRAHFAVNQKFNKWLGRSIIAFSCEFCLIVVLICAAVFTKSDSNTVII